MIVRSSSRSRNPASVAAAAATGLSAHREALGLYRRALRNLPADVTPHEEAMLLAALANEASAVDDNVAADEGYARAHALWTGAGATIALALPVLNRPPGVAAG